MSKSFDMKDMRQANYALGIKLHKDRAASVLGLCQRTYKSEIFSEEQCLKNEVERNAADPKEYAFIVLLKVALYML